MHGSKRTKNPIKVKIGTGNVFQDLGLGEPGEKLAKAQLAGRICEVIAGEN